MTNEAKLLQIFQKLTEFWQLNFWKSSVTISQVIRSKFMCVQRPLNGLRCLGSCSWEDTGGAGGSKRRAGNNVNKIITYAYIYIYTYNSQKKRKTFCHWILSNFE